MTKKELIEKVAEETEVTKVQVEKVLASILGAIQKGVKKDGLVQLIGFGNFKKTARKARTGRNPQTGETIKIKASKSVGFKVAKTFKEML